MADLGAARFAAISGSHKVDGRCRAIDQPEREVAVKVITPQRAGRHPRARFRREWLAASIRHPHVVTIYRAGDDGCRSRPWNTAGTTCGR
jgi:hypothetical protein